MKTLLCNCRGAGNPNFCQNFAELIRYHQPSIVVLVETRISSQRAEIISTGLGFDSVVHFEAEGFSGGIWLLWDSDVVNLDVSLSIIKSSMPQCKLVLHSTLGYSLLYMPVLYMHLAFVFRTTLHLLPTRTPFLG